MTSDAALREIARIIVTKITAGDVKAGEKQLVDRIYRVLLQASVSVSGK